MGKDVTQSSVKFLFLAQIFFYDYAARVGLQSHRHWRHLVLTITLPLELVESAVCEGRMQGEVLRRLVCCQQLKIIYDEGMAIDRRLEMKDLATSSLAPEAVVSYGFLGVVEPNERVKLELDLLDEVDQIEGVLIGTRVEGAVGNDNFSAVVDRIARVQMDGEDLINGVFIDGDLILVGLFLLLILMFGVLIASLLVLALML